MTHAMHYTDTLTLRPAVGIVGIKDAEAARTELNCDYVEYIGSHVFAHPSVPERNTVVYRFRAGMFATPAA